MSKKHWYLDFFGIVMQASSGRNVSLNVSTGIDSENKI